MMKTKKNKTQKEKNILLRIDEFVANYTSNRVLRYSLYCFVSIILICLVWFFLTYWDFLDGIWYIFKKREIHYIFGIAIAIVSLIFGLMILDNVVKESANNIIKFLELLNEFFDYSRKNDVIKIVTPTLFIGKAEQSKSSNRYLRRITNLINNNSNVEILSYKIPSSFIDSFNAIKENDKNEIHNKTNLITKIAKSDKLINFHKKLFLEISDVESRKYNEAESDYFKEFISFYNELNLPEIEDYSHDGELKAILFLNKSKDIGVFGVYSDKYNISGFLIKEKDVMDSLEKMIS